MTSFLSEILLPFPNSNDLNSRDFQSFEIIPYGVCATRRFNTITVKLGDFGLPGDFGQAVPSLLKKSVN